MIIVNYGEGKGKTTAAIGTALRAIAANWNVVIVQFLKASDSGEIKLLHEYPNVSIIRKNNMSKFSFAINKKEKEEVRAVHTADLLEGINLFKQGKCDMLVLDEVLGAIETGLIDEAPLKELIENKPKNLELILTGRILPDYIEEAADYITEMRSVRHPYEKGIEARRGIEY